jgi:hypothetical protein
VDLNSPPLPFTKVSATLLHHAQEKTKERRKPATE